MLEPTGCLGFLAMAVVTHTIGNTLAQSGLVCLKNRKTVAWGHPYSWAKVDNMMLLVLSIYRLH
jgi:hypothetical protein